MTIIEQLKRDEGLRLNAYKDSVGILTIGYGHNLAAHEQHVTSCTIAQAEAWLVQDAADAKTELLGWLPWTAKLDEVRFAVLWNMAFNMGDKLLGFHKTLNAVQRGDWAEASADMLQSKWQQEVGVRAVRLSHQLLSGQWV